MKKQFGIAALLLIPLGAAFAYQQEKKATPAGAPADDPMKAKMMEFATPGPEHKVLATKIGKWTAKTKCWMEPGATPKESTATAEYKWILGERFIQGTDRSTFLDMPFEGIGTAGFDKMKKKYQMSWIDSMGTGIAYFEGTYDQASKTFTYTGQCPDPMQGKYVSSRIVEKMTDADHFNMQMFSTGPDGKEIKTFEAEYMRAK